MAVPRFRELLAVIGRASDVGMGLPDDRALRNALLAHGLARAAGYDPSAARDAVWCALLRFAGCTAESHLASNVMGDEIRVRGSMYGTAHFAEPREMLAFMWKVAADGRSGVARVAEMMRMMRNMPALWATAVAHCEVNEILAHRLGLDGDVIIALGQSFECWNGSGMPLRLRGEAIAPSARIAVAADELEAAHRLGGVDGAVAIARRRSGRVLDPRLCERFVADAIAICRPLEAPSPLGELTALEIAGEPRVADEDLEGLCEGLADMADLKCAWTRGHSRRVAALTDAASALLRVPADARRALHRAALLHDLGRIGVSSSIWDHAGPLSDAQWDRVREHSAGTERVLARAPFLGEALDLAAIAHERLDGGGYHRRLPPASLGTAARILAAADVLDALRSIRPHRAALDRDRSVAVLRDEAKAGRLDGEAVEAVLAAAGERPAVQAHAPAGLTERECEVLRLVARGLSNKQIAAELGIATKTAGNHVQNVLGKVGVSSRAAAAMFAMRSGLVS